MMAFLPPRKNPTPTRLKQNPTPLQTLLQMGFSKHRAEKALAATGNRGSVQLASDWLLSHVNDPFLDDQTPREYILYACPTGPLLQKLQEFWDKSREMCGWNGAHNFMPHITLVSFFKASDDNAPKLMKSLRHVTTKGSALKLELYTSPNFMGFFVGEEDASYLKSIALQFVKEVSDTTISLDPHVKSLHLTLAYQFPADQFNALKSLVETLDPTTEAAWELRLYSRDQRLATRQVHRIVYPYAAPTEADELELMMGDYVYLNPDNLQSSDGWVEGISWLTGTSGFLPINYTERCAESEAWVLHRTAPLGDSVTAGAVEEKSVVAQANSTAEKRDSTAATKVGAEETPDPSDVYRLLSEKAITYDLNDPETGRPTMSPSVTRVFMMRHGERVDFTFGNWLSYSLDAAGNYVQQDLNLPDHLPQRSDPQAWDKDSPLTRVGVYQARLLGEALRRDGIVIDKAYSSPAFRCVSTCSSVLEGLQQKEAVAVNVDPSLFEWCMWHKAAGVTHFDWLSTEELAEGGFNVNAAYEVRVTPKELEANMEESVEEYHERNGRALDEIVAGAEGQNILIVGHASSLEVAHQRLTERPVRTSTEFNRLVHKIPYCGLVGFERDLAKGNGWTLVEGAKYSVTHTANQRFDSGVFQVGR